MKIILLIIWIICVANGSLRREMNLSVKALFEGYGGIVGVISLAILYLIPIAVILMFLFG